MKPRITFGVSLEEMVGGERSVSMVLPQYYAAILYYKFDGPIWSKLVISIIYLFILQQVKTLLKLYAREQYILVVNQQQGDFEVFVSFKVCI